MGPDFVSDGKYTKRIDGVTKNAANFGPVTNDYIMIHCDDPKKECHKRRSDDVQQVIGGYGWSNRHWFWWTDHHIALWYLPDPCKKPSTR